MWHIGMKVNENSKIRYFKDILNKVKWLEEITIDDPIVFEKELKISGADMFLCDSRPNDIIFDYEECIYLFDKYEECIYLIKMLIF